MVTQHLHALTDNELERYSSHFLLPNWSESAQLSLKNANVVVVGAGGLGVPVATLLACSGVGQIKIIDFDMVNTTNLARQFAYTPDEVGQSKADCLARKLQAQNPHVVVKPVIKKLDADNCDSLLMDCDVLLDCSDRFKTRFLVNDYCVKQQLPFVYGAVYQYQGMVALFNTKQGSGCLRCLMDESQLQDENTTCQQMGILATTTNLVASLMVQKLFNFLTDPIHHEKTPVSYVQMEQGVVREMNLPVMPGCDCTLMPKR